MRRIYWDAMLLIYLLDNHVQYSARVQALLEHSFERNDQLLTSCVGLGEVMAGAHKAPHSSTAKIVRKAIDEMGFLYLPFGAAAVDTFSDLRSIQSVKTADAIHLACASAAGVDLFLTGDTKLTKLYVPGIHFIVDFNTSFF